MFRKQHARATYFVLASFVFGVTGLALQRLTFVSRWSALWQKFQRYGIESAVKIAAILGVSGGFACDRLCCLFGRGEVGIGIYPRKSCTGTEFRLISKVKRV